MNNFKKIVKNPKFIFLILDKLNVIRISDKYYLELMYNWKFNKKININNPITFNEKMQYLKLFDRKEIYTTMVDKCKVKEYVSKIIGSQYIIPTIATYKNFDEIDFSKLPNQFVIKCTHDSGGLVICRDKNNLNMKLAKKKIEKSLKNNFYYSYREWPYKNVERQIIIEKYMQNSDEMCLKDYKFYCFNGQPKFLYISEGLENHQTAKISFFDMNFNFAEFGRSDFAEFDKKPPKPKNFEKMKQLAEQLSRKHKFLRVDFYEINNQIYFSELTLYPCGGFMPFKPEEWDRKLGDYIKIK